MKLYGEEAEKRELEKKLYGVSKVIEDTVKKHEIERSQLSENFNVSWNKYQAKKVELKTANKCMELLKAELNELIKTNDNLDCRLEELNEKYKCLERDNRELNNCLIVSKKKINNLKSDNEIQTQSLSENAEELTRTKHKLMETNDESKEVEEECRKLRNKMEFLQDELLDAVEKAKMSELMLIKDIDVLKSENHIEETRNAELNRNLCGEKSEQRELRVALKKSNEKCNALKETLKETRSQTDLCIDELRKEKSNIEKEKKYLENKTEEQMEELREIECQNKKLCAQINEMVCELETVIKNTDETQKLSSEKLEQTISDTKRLKTEITSKDQTILELREKLFKTERTHKTEIENVYCLKREIENLKQNPNIMPFISYNPCSCPDHDYHNTDYVNEVLDEIKLDETKTPMTTIYNKEKITECDSV